MMLGLKIEVSMLNTKKNLENILINRLEEKFPGIKEHIVVTELGTPRTMERYTNNPKGAVYGYAQSVKQAGRHD